MKKLKYYSELVIKSKEVIRTQGLKAFITKVKDRLNGGNINVGQICQLQKQGSDNIETSSDGKHMSAFNISSFSSRNYPHKKSRKVIFATSSGLCNLQCPYCITNRPRINNNLNRDDFSYIFKYLGENIYFVFSGLGDFFCGYPKNEQLLGFLLRHDVSIYLDINGVDIKELGETELEGCEKIDMINISYHFGTMKKQKVLNTWVDSIRKIHLNRINYDIKMVVSPVERDIWDEAILFYRNEVQPITGQRLMLAPDGLIELKDQLSGLKRIAELYKDTVVSLGRESIYKERRFPPAGTLPCPAGSRYFRVLNNGDIMPCELFDGHLQVRLGNLKRRDITTFKRDVYCDYTGFCDCSWATNPRTGLLYKGNTPYFWRKASG